VLCDAGSCARITGNTILGNLGADVVGVLLSGSGPLVDRNTITGGCGTDSTAGLLTDDANARIENNLVRGATCANNLTTGASYGLHLHVARGGNELDVHSNTVDAGGAGDCEGAAVIFGTTGGNGTAADLRKGLFRNNILRAGGCATRYDFWEDSPPATPRGFDNNDLDPGGAPTALYLSADATPLTTIAAVNAITSPTNLSVDPMFVAPPGDLHLGATSMCIDTGTTAGAPATDFAGKSRDAKPDLGAYEH
jgi:hypothetical protein